MAEVDDAATQSVELRHNDAADPARAAGLERSAQAGPLERLTAECVLLDSDELPTPSLAFTLRLERIRFEAHDVLAEISVDADSAEEADARALEAARFIPAWRVIVIRLDPPAEASSRASYAQPPVGAAAA